jgi:hypothetical protein
MRYGIALVALVAESATAQTALKFVNDSPNAPMTLIGKGQITAEHVTYDVDAKNVSGREVIAFVATGSILNEGRFHQFYSSRHDHYFKAEGIQPDEVIIGVMRGDNMPWSHALTTVHTKLVFAEFADGSVWGDRSAGQIIVSERKQLVSFDEQIENAYLQGGESGFLAFVRQRASGPKEVTVWPVADKVLKMQQTAGTAAAIEYVQGKLKNARQHSSIAEF